MNEASSVQELIARYFECDSFAVVGASTNREKYGNKVLRAYQQRQLRVYPINPKAAQVEGIEAYPDLASLPEPVCGISIITPPAVTERVVDEAAAAGVRYVWMQPGAESDEAIRKAHAHGMGVIADGSCFLVVSGYRESE